MWNRMKHPSILLALLVFSSIARRAAADEPIEHRAWSFLSRSGAIAYGAAGLGLPLIEDGRRGPNRSLRIADALGTSVALSEALKPLSHEKRPDGNGHDSFPSTHATAAFSIATVEGGLHSRQAAYRYVGAALISASRVGLHRHTIGDILAGAALGYAVARLELSSQRGLLLSPVIQKSQRGIGFSFSTRF